MTLFDGKPLETEMKLLTKRSSIVISASRMTDMPKYYPEEIIKLVNSKIKAGLDIHTLVLWTKHPNSLLINPLRDFLYNIREFGIQLYLQCTITGLGKRILGKCRNGSNLVLEPNSPSMEDSILSLPDVISILDSPRRIRLRIDPIIRIEDALGTRFSSLKFMPIIIKKVKAMDIRDISFSFLESGVHRKVDRRFRELGVRILPPNTQERLQTVEWLKKLELEHKVNIRACCTPGFPESKCIDGQLLQYLHNNKKDTVLKEPRKRKMCGCTYSIDIGGWPPRKCFTGCQYCYANSSY